jgi:hypothetical protein
MYNLSLNLIDARNAFDKTFKYVVGDKMVDKAMLCLALIHYANEDRRKGAREEHLSKFLIEFDILKTYTMVCRDRRQFKKVSALADIFILLADIESQASRWRQSSRLKAGASE